MSEGFIVTCGCNDTDEFAKNAFRLLFSCRGYPPISHNVPTIQSPKTLDFIGALEKSGKPYAYYFRDGDVFEAWDLLKGVRVQ